MEFFTQLREFGRHLETDVHGFRSLLQGYSGSAQGGMNAEPLLRQMGFTMSELVEGVKKLEDQLKPSPFFEDVWASGLAGFNDLHEKVKLVEERFQQYGFVSQDSVPYPFPLDESKSEDIAEGDVQKDSAQGHGENMESPMDEMETSKDPMGDQTESMEVEAFGPPNASGEIQSVFVESDAFSSPKKEVDVLGLQKKRDVGEDGDMDDDFADVMKTPTLEEYGISASTINALRAQHQQSTTQEDKVSGAAETRITPMKGKMSTLKLNSPHVVPSGPATGEKEADIDHPRDSSTMIPQMAEIEVEEYGVAPSYLVHQISFELLNDFVRSFNEYVLDKTFDQGSDGTWVTQEEMREKMEFGSNTKAAILLLKNAKRIRQKKVNGDVVYYIP
jgi:hypothetical protein